MTPGERLQNLRNQLDLTLREVKEASFRIAARHHNAKFGIPIGRLSEIENRDFLPSIYRLHTLAVIYRRDFRELLGWYGINVNEIAADLEVASPRRSHVMNALQNTTAVRMPVSLDPGFDPRKTLNLGRVIEQWGIVPLTYLAHLATTEYTYGYVGSEDLTMYPLLAPGSFIQVDEARNAVVNAVWRSEYERPIYFVETREGYTCCWCALHGEHIILQPHPLSPVAARILKYGQQAEVVGQVVGVAMKLGEWRASSPSPAPKAPLELS